ncbi:CHAT domain-containing tetratricopeptide repeat protein [Nostoc sp.]|uniref:CHAT domain-containing tetratricopeptide repeat protein n=1 Tax=Nostoc sp. TaxID=1180 RepID=UPI002FFA949D
MNHIQDIVALANQADIIFSNQAYQEALEAYNSAVKMTRKLGRSRLVAVFLNRIGDTFQAQGEIQEAVIAYEAALQALESEDESKIDSVIHRLSRVSKGFYNNPETIPDLYSIRVAQTLEAEENDPTLPIKLWLNIGNAYLRQPQEAPALNAYQEALQYPEIETNPLLKAYAIANIGEIHRRQDKLDLAETELEQALQLFDRSGEPAEKRRVLAFLAAVKRNRQQFNEAEILYKQALLLYEQVRDNLGKGRALAGLARLYLEQKCFSDAETAYQQAKALAETINDREVLGYCYWGLGCCYQEAGKLEQAIASFQKSLKLSELRQQNLLTDEGKVSFLDSIKDIFDRLLIAHLDLAQRDGGDYQAALEIAESARARALQDLMQGNKRHRAKLQKNLPIDANKQRQQEQQQVQQRAIGTSVERHQGELDENIILTEAPPIARLVFYVLLDRIAIFAVTSDGRVSGHVCPIGCHDLEKKVACLRRAMQVDEASRGIDRKLFPVENPESVELHPEDIETLLQEFYTNLVAPVAEVLPTDGSTLVIEPHASLWLVPFAALQLPDRTWMSDRWAFVYAASAQTLAEIRNEPCYATLDRSKVLVVGNPLMPKIRTQDGEEIELSPLSGAEAEARSIVASLGDRQHTLLLREQATETAVKDFAQTHNIIHLATHGIAYTANPLASFIAFSPTATEDGLLTAREVAENRDLPADLIVLSACQTGLGKISGDGMLGLSRAFLIAGARTVVVSQWSVSDSATKELMVVFHQNYLQSGNKAIALQKAMHAVRSQAEYKNPRYWAPFIVVGAEV